MLIFCSGRDVRFRELCRDHDLVLLGRVDDVEDGRVLVDGANLPSNMARIEANVQIQKHFINGYIIGSNDPELQSLPPLEQEPQIEIPPCEMEPLHSLDLAAHNVKTVVVSAGYAIELDKIVNLPDLFDDRGYPNQTRGCAHGYPGLYFLGLHWMHKWKSAILLGCAEDSKHVCDQISVRCQQIRSLARPAPQIQSPSSLVRVNSTSNQLVCQSPGKQSTGTAVLGYLPDQQTTKQAAEGEWTTYFDLLEDSDAILIRSASEQDRSTKQPLTYSQLRQFILKFDLSAFGVTQGDRVCLVAPNGPESAVSFLTFSLFCTYAPLNHKLTEREYEFEFGDLPAKVVIVMDGVNNDIVLQVASRHGLPVLLLTPAKEHVGIFSLSWYSETKLEALVGGPQWPTREDIALVLHTSGTTKKPKIVPLTHRNICSGGMCIASTLQLAPSDVCLNIMPLFHIHGIAVNVLVTALSGASVVCSPGMITPDQFFKWLVQDPRPTWYSAVPTMHQLVLGYAEGYHKQHGKPPPHSLGFIRNCSAALLPTVSARMESLLGVQIVPTCK